VDVAEQDDVDRAAVVLHRQQVLAGAFIAGGDLVQGRRQRRAGHRRLGRQAVDVLLADQRLRADFATGVFAEVLEAFLFDLQDDGGLRLRRRRHRGDLADLDAGDLDLLPGDDVAGVVEDRTDFVGLVGPARRQRERRLRENEASGGHPNDRSPASHAPVSHPDPSSSSQDKAGDSTWLRRSRPPHCFGAYAFLGSSSPVGLLLARARRVVFGRDRFFFQTAETGEREFGLDRQIFFGALRRQRAVVGRFAVLLDRRTGLDLDVLDRRVLSTGHRFDERNFGFELLGEFAARADVVRLREDFQQHRFVAEREERQAAAGGVERFDRRGLRHDFFAEGDEALDGALGTGGRALRAGLRALARRFEDRGRAGREAAGVQLRAGRQVEVDVRQRRREPAVFGAFDRVFGFDRRAGAEDVAGVREAGDRHGLRFEFHRRRRRGRARQRERKDGETENGKTAGCSAHQFHLSSVDGQVRLDPGSSGATAVRARSGNIEIPSGGTWRLPGGNTNHTAQSVQVATCARTRAPQAARYEGTAVCRSGCSVA